MTDAQTTLIDVRLPTCPLCHTIDRTITPESLRAGATWNCTRCGQTWSAERLDTVAAYARFVAAQQAPASGTTL